MDLPPKPEPDRCGGRGSLEDVGALVASRSHRTEPVEVVDRQLNFVARPVDFRIEAGRATAVTAPTALVGPQTPRLGTSSHPRVHGEHGPEQGCAYANAGPPPRARGPLAGRHGAALARGPPPRARGPRLDRRTRDVDRGTTPACAGTAGAGRVRRSCRWDHPRVCGDHPCYHELLDEPGGPSPRARGPREITAHAGLGTGTTPACAGTTRRGSAAPPSGRDHPRVRGDHRTMAWMCGCQPGPPPRARGPRLPLGRQQGPAGTTPACAGTTSSPSTWTARPEDHPRVRGDHVHRHRGVETVSGTTPACAGTTIPRAVMTVSSPGPPPRARGPRPRDGPRGAGPGTTPACAGTTRVR